MMQASGEGTVLPTQGYVPRHLTEAYLKGCFSKQPLCGQRGTMTMSTMDSLPAASSTTESLPTLTADALLQHTRMNTMNTLDSLPCAFSRRDSECSSNSECDKEESMAPAIADGNSRSSDCLLQGCSSLSSSTLVTLSGRYRKATASRKTLERLPTIASQSSDGASATSYQRSEHGSHHIRSACHTRDSLPQIDDDEDDDDEEDIGHRRFPRVTTRDSLPALPEIQEASDDSSDEDEAKLPRGCLQDQQQQQQQQHVTSPVSERPHCAVVKACPREPVMPWPSFPAPVARPQPVEQACPRETVVSWPSFPAPVARAQPVEQDVTCNVAAVNNLVGLPVQAEQIQTNVDVPGEAVASKCDVSLDPFTTEASATVEADGIADAKAKWLDRKAARKAKAKACKRPSYGELLKKQSLEPKTMTPAPAVENRMAAAQPVEWHCNPEMLQLVSAREKLSTIMSVDGCSSADRDSIASDTSGMSCEQPGLLGRSLTRDSLPRNFTRDSLPRIDDVSCSEADSSEPEAFELSDAEAEDSETD